MTYKGSRHDLFEHSLKNREDFYITVIVDSCFTVGFQMEWVDHIDIIQVSSSSLICKIDRMLQRNIPDWECLKFGITGSNSTLVFMV